jgi:valyl-tRNA synthetase
MEVFHEITNPGNPDFKYYYPASVLVTGQDIIFFWVTRMIMAGLEFRHAIPFPDVYFTGMVRDHLGRKMSKSLGNSPDLLQLIDKYGADAVRFGILISAPAGNDLLFDEAGLEQGRNFNNKLWNALKLVHMWRDKLSKAGQNAPESDPGFFAVKWFDNRFNQAKSEINKLFADFKLSEALKNIYSLIWDDFCSWYLEWVKPGYEQALDSLYYEKTISFFEDLLLWLHPFMPFVTEEIYHLLRDRAEGDDLCIKQFVPEFPFSSPMHETGERLRLFLTVGREFRQQQQLKSSEPITRIFIPQEIFGKNESLYAIILKQLNCTKIDYIAGSIPGDPGIQVIPFQTFQVGFESPRQVDGSKRKEELEKELIYYKGFLDTLNKKLSNERFVQNAKAEVVELEKKKKSDTEDKITAILLTLNT